MHQLKASRTGASVRNPLPRLRPKNWLYRKAAEENVVAPKGAFGVVAPGLVPAVLVKTVAGICEESSECDQQGCRQRLEYRLGCSPGQILPEPEADGETSAHEAGKKCNENTLSEVEVLHSSLCPFAGLLGLASSGCTYDGNADEGDDYSNNNGEGKVGCVTGEDGGKQGSQTCACAEGDGLPEGYAKIAHGEAERQAADTPQNAEKYGFEGFSRMCCIHCKKRFA